MKNIDSEKNALIRKTCAFARSLLPRILTQIARDRSLPLAGCADRNYWHYKIRDFASIIIQQAGYTVWKANGIADYPEAALRRIARDSCLFWNRRAVMFRAFEEYYPWEEGYPPLAFSALSAAKLVDEGVVDPQEVLPGLKVAAHQLQKRFEPQATNQQMAGTAALCLMRKIVPELVTTGRLEAIIAESLRCQHEEGWFMEYGGSDTGYLSVTMDCLWDAYDATGDERFVRSAGGALRFISMFLELSPRGAGMHNSRNTDYIVPYGIARFLKIPEYSRLAAEILFRLLGRIDQPDHFFHAVDDRYWCHYIGHSLYRALPLLKLLPEEAPESRSPSERRLNGSGHVLRYAPAPFPAMISTLKGGIFTLFDRDGRTFSDFGWQFLSDGKIWTNHWFSRRWTVKTEDRRIEVTGFLSGHAFLKNTPFRHAVLRILSFCFGRRIIAFLKSRMIFKKDDRRYPFSREIVFERDRVAVRDRFSVAPGIRPVRASRASQRHVASADSFHYEDFSLQESNVRISRTEKAEFTDDGCRITTIYSYAGER